MGRGIGAAIVINSDEKVVGEWRPPDANELPRTGAAFGFFLTYGVAFHLHCNGGIFLLDICDAFVYQSMYVNVDVRSCPWASGGVPDYKLGALETDTYAVTSMFLYLLLFVTIFAWALRKCVGFQASEQDFINRCLLEGDRLSAAGQVRLCALFSDRLLPTGGVGLPGRLL